MAAIDEFTAYSPIELLPVVRTQKEQDLFLRSTVVKGEVYSDSTVVEFDSEEMSNHAATYVSRLGGPNEVGEQGYETAQHCIPYLYEQKSFQPEDFLDRLPGEVVGDGVAVASRMEIKMTKGIQNLSRRFDMAEELQVKEALETGKVTVDGKGVKYLVDFQRDTALTVTNTGTDKWSDSGSDKLDQLSALCRVGETHGYSYNEALMSPEAGNALLQDEAIQKLLDLKNFDMGAIEIKNLRDQKATYLGTLRWPGFELALYVYRGLYTDNANAVKPVLTKDIVILRDTGANWKMHYGMISNFKAPSFKGKRFAMNSVSEDGKRARTTLESGPLIGMFEPNSTGVIKTEG